MNSEYLLLAKATHYNIPFKIGVDDFKDLEDKVINHEQLLTKGHELGLNFDRENDPCFMEQEIELNEYKKDY